MSAFKGFQQVGGFTSTVKPTQLFQGFTDTAYGQVGGIGGVPSTNLVAWFNPSLNITLGTGVKTWMDTSSTYTLTQNTGASQPSLNSTQGTYNGRPYFGWSGSPQTMNGGNILNIGTSQYLDVVIIIAPTSIANTGIVLSSDNGGSLSTTQGRYAIRQSAASAQFQYADTGGAYNLSASGLINNQLTMVLGSIDRVVGKLYISMDYNWHVGNTNIVASSTNYSGNNFEIGSGAGSYFNGSTLDTFIYAGSSALSQSDYLMFRNYVGQLYGF